MPPTLARVRWKTAARAPPHHVVRRVRQPGRLLPRTLRPGPQLDPARPALADRHRVLLVDMPNHGRSPWTDRSTTSPWPTRSPSCSIRPTRWRSSATRWAPRPRCSSRCATRSSWSGSWSSTWRPWPTPRLGLPRLHRRDAGHRTSRPRLPRGRGRCAPRQPYRTTAFAAFLLQNLHRSGEWWSWQPQPRAAARRCSAPSAAGPMTRRGPPAVRRADAVDRRRGLAVREGRVRARHGGALPARAPKVTIKGAGHWVHSEKPEVFREVLRRFVD
jgi:esterase